jgi:N-acetylglutamate synthase-like GNAT family acetyltransferase
MNPLGIKPENFTVVEDSNGAGVIAFAQLAALPAPNTAEFRSLVVLPEHRGKDIGSGLLQHIVGGTSANVYLTTLRKTIPFYEAAGFKLLQASEVPW